MARLLYQGHASLRFQTDDKRVVYVDPFAGEGYVLPADLVLVTHEHYDHNAVNLVPSTERTIVIRSKDALENGNYHSFSYWGIGIQAVPAYNKNHDIHECVGFILTMDGLKIYVAGDTDETPEMKEIGKMGIDYCFLPIDGVFNMGPKDASRCARIIHPKHLIPYHMHPGRLWDPQQDMQVTYPGAMLVKPGDLIRL